MLKKTKLQINITGGQKNYGSKSSGTKENNGKPKTAKKQTMPVYNEKAMLLSSDEEVP